MAPILAVIAFAILFIVVAIAAHYAAVRRREELRAVARELGFTFDESSRRGFDREWPHFECFRRGHSRRAFSVMEGRIPLEGWTEPDSAGADAHAMLGDFEFKETQSTGKSTRTVTYRFTFAIVQFPRSVCARQLPDMLVRREHLFDKVAGFLGFDDIDFESAEFSRAFHVMSSDKRFAYDLIDARLMEFLLAAGTPNVDLGGNAVCLWHSQSRQLPPREWPALLSWGRQFVARWPRLVRSQISAVPGA